MGKLGGREPEGGVGGREQIGRGGCQGDGFMGEERGEEGGIAGVGEGGRGQGEQAMGEDGGRKAVFVEGEEMGGRGAQELAQEGEEELVGALTGAGEQITGRCGGVTEEGGAHGALQIGVQGGIGASEAIEEGVPGSGGSGRIEVVGEEMGEIVVGIVREEIAGAEVEGTVVEIEQEGVGVEGRWGEKEVGEGAGEAKEGLKARERFAVGQVGEDAVSELCILMSEGADLLKKVFEGFAGEGEHSILIGG